MINDTNDTPEADARRLRSIAQLVERGVPYIDHLPNKDDEQYTHRRSNEEVGLRILCLALVSMKGANADHDFIHEGVKHFNVIDEFSPNELAFILDKEPNARTKTQFAWRVEAAHALLWAAGLVQDFTYPSKACDWQRFWSDMQDKDREPFLAKINLRSQAEILDQADLIYRFHWAARDANLVGKTPPAQLDLDVVMERHTALNWLIVPKDEPYPWDEISNDT